MTSTSMQYHKRKFTNIMNLPQANRHQKNYSIEFADDTDQYNINRTSNEQNKRVNFSHNSPMKYNANFPSRDIQKVVKTPPMSPIINSKSKPFTPNLMQKNHLKRGSFSYKKEFITDTKKSYDMQVNVQYNNMNLFQGENANKINTHYSLNSIDLNKYKILSAPNSSDFLNINKKSPNHKKSTQDNNQDITSLSQFKIDINRDQKKNKEKNDGNPFSPVMTPVIINNINLQNLNPMDDYQNNKESSTIIESFSYFRSKKKFEQASRRMIIELLKQEKPENSTLTNVLSLWKLDPIVLEQEKQVIKQSNPYLSLMQDVTRFNPSSFETLPKNIQSTYKNISTMVPMNKFVLEMNDEKKDRINMINFLSVPRVMDMIIEGEHIPFIFVLSPNSICYLYGIETYVFKWREFKDHLNYGYFDLMKVLNCTTNKVNSNQFQLLIEDNSEDNLEDITYDIEAPNSDICKTYVECFNFLTQLIKCKAYQRRCI